MTGCKLTVAATNAAIALYQKIYPDINWVTHEYALENHDHWQAIYRLGVFAQANSPYQVIGYRQNNLITHAQMILGIPLRLSPPDLTSLNLQPTADLPKDYIVIAPQGSGAKKTWSMPYWQELCDVLVSRGINVVAVGDGPIPTGIINRSGRHPLETTLSIIKYAKAFIGGPSGCYAMAWFVDTPSGHHQWFHECHRRGTHALSSLSRAGLYGLLGLSVRTIDQDRPRLPPCRTATRFPPAR